MTDHELELRVRAWYAGEIGTAEPAPPGLYHSVTAIPEAIGLQPLPRSARPRLLLLVAAALLGTLIVGSVAIGSGMVKLPVVVPPPTASTTASPSVPATPAATLADRPWMTGRELMDALSEESGFEWHQAIIGSPDRTVYMSELSAEMTPGTMTVDRPFDSTATVWATAEADAYAATGAQQFDILIALLAPDMAAWIADALEQGLASEETFSLTTETPNGGYVAVLVYREEVINDWVGVYFSPEASRLPLP